MDFDPERLGLTGLHRNGRFLPIGIRNAGGGPDHPFVERNARRVAGDVDVSHPLKLHGAGRDGCGRAVVKQIRDACSRAACVGFRVEHGLPADGFAARAADAQSVRRLFRAGGSHLLGQAVAGPEDTDLGRCGLPAAAGQGHDDDGRPDQADGKPVAWSHAGLLRIGRNTSCALVDRSQRMRCAPGIGSEPPAGDRAVEGLFAVPPSVLSGFGYGHVHADHATFG